ncbi:hypothetical protein B0T24DRAFT_164182 [Lasiosphaeria ovina]|uniref:Uncharacterized protein n=1 Tax=Lasiosphaeria ovina TaxID=92902 RepID=A0AAE0NDS6_9PEZI|nr:hypothetical protein B0T24DRAFT_164182 [Lasiosphaeria ovina]
MVQLVIFLATRQFRAARGRKAWIAVSFFAIFFATRLAERVMLDGEEVWQIRGPILASHCPEWAAISPTYTICWFLSACLVFIYS